MGDNGVYGLGVLELRLADVDVNLRLSSEITIAPSAEDDRNDIDAYGKSKDIFYGDGIRKPWAIRSHEYQVRVDLTLASGLEFQDETFTQQVAVKLKHLEVWPSLGFEVTSVEICSSDDAATSWTLSLDYCEHMSEPKKAKLHKLALDIPYYDVKPPSGIPVIKVEAICIKILLRKPLAHGSLKPNRCADREGGNMKNHREMLFNRINEVQLFSNTKAESGADSGLRSSKTYLEQEHSMSVAEGDYAYLTPPPSQETKEESREELTLQPVQETVSHVSAETVLSSIETGLKHTMRDLPSRMSRTNIITSNEDFDSLAKIVPALWMPEYHKSMSERAVFLPTVSHAIANVARNSSASLGLRIKTWQLSNRYPHPGNEVPSEHPPGNNDGMQQALSVSLWTAISSALKARTARQSRLFCDSFASGDQLNAFGDTGDMLDIFAESDKLDQIGDVYDSDDLLDTVSETDNESMSNWSIDDSGDVHGPCCTEVSEHRLLDRWNTEHLSLLDPEFDMFDYGSELRGNLPESVFEAKDGAVEGNGDRRDRGRCWNGSDRDHDSVTLRFLETEGEESNAEDMLLEHGEDGAKPSSGQVDSAGCADTEYGSGREEHERSGSLDAAGHAHDEEDLLDWTS